MILLAAVDSHMHSLPHSRVMPLLPHLRSITEKGKLWIRPASAELFQKESFPNVHVSDDPLSEAGFSDFVYAEDIPVNDRLDTINKVYLYHFAADAGGALLDADLSDWQLFSSETMDIGEAAEEEIYVLW